MDWNAIRDEFPITKTYNYQNNAAVAPMCRRSALAVQTFLGEAVDHSCVRGSAYQEAERVRRLSASLLNATADEICFVKNTTEGLNFVSTGIAWNPGDNVVTTNVEFPANVHCWLALRKRGVTIRQVRERNGRIPLEEIVESIDENTRVVTISSVQYASGFRSDLASLGRECRSRGVWLCVDAIQSLGVLPVDVKAMHIDFLSADAHKWLCGPEGLGIFFIRKELLQEVAPVFVGWLGMEGAMDFEHGSRELQSTAKRYDTGAYNLMGIYALGGALDFLMEIGIENIWERVRKHTDMLCAGVQEKGYRVFSPREGVEASGIVSFVSDKRESAALQKQLFSEHRIVVSTRSGRLRSSPHLYNSEQEIEQLIAALPEG